MKKSLKTVFTILLLIIILVGAVFAYNHFGDRYQPPVSSPSNDTGKQPIPDFVLMDENGNEVSLSDYRGKPIVLNIWATWCTYCRAEMPDFNEAYLDYPEIQFLMVNATDGVRETVDMAKEYLAQESFDFPVVFDVRGEAVSTLFVRSYPSTYFIDEEGRLASFQNGRMSREMLEQHIQALLSEK